jgi:hypothetical protein
LLSSDRRDIKSKSNRNTTLFFCTLFYSCAFNTFIFVILIARFLLFCVKNPLLFFLLFFTTRFYTTFYSSVYF